MAARFGLALLLATSLTAPALADVTIVSENFDGYADDAAFQAAWVPTVGNGSAAANAADVSSGIITTDATAFPGIQGKAVDHIGATASTPGMVNQFGGVINQGAGSNPVFSINPSATQKVRLSVDLFDGASGNERMSIGLRNISVAGTTVTTTNLLEMGFWNATTTDPTLPTTPPPPVLVSTGYAARINLFGAVSAPLVRQPDWQYFALPTELDRPLPADGVVNIADIGRGWHTYTATISPTEIVFTIDLFRDGLRNTSITPDVVTGIRPGTAGVDATMTFPVATLPSGFNSLRIGGPSGLVSGGTGVTGFDNIVLKLVDNIVPPADDADFDGDGDIDGADFLTWQRGLGAAGELADGDANGDLFVDADDLAIWRTQYGTAVPVVASIPEPATVALAAMALLATITATRRRR